MTHLTKTGISKRDLQKKLELLFSKNQLIPRIKSEFTNSGMDIKGYLEAHGIPPEFGLDLLVQMVLHKRADLKTLVGILRHHFDNSQQCADMLLKMAETDLLQYDTNLRIFIVVLDITQDVQDELDRFQFPLPMVVEPEELTRNSQTGYLTTGGSVILRKNHHNDDVCLDHLNRMNQVKLTVNLDTVAMVQNRWRNLDKAKEGETREDFEKRKKAFEKYDRTARDVIGLLMENTDHFHLTHRYDKRGRIYCQGYHCTYQGSPWNKAVIELYDAEVVPD